jgi:thioredoxin 1
MSDETNENHNQEKTQPSLELLDFWAVWCGPCKIMEPILEEIEQEFGDKLTITKLNVDEEPNQPLVSKYNVLSIPTYVLLKDGEVIETFIGVQPKALIANKITTTLG